MASLEIWCGLSRTSVKMDIRFYQRKRGMCAIKCGSQLGCLGAVYPCSVIRNTEGRRGTASSTEFSRLFLSRSVTGVCSVVVRENSEQSWRNYCFKEQVLQRARKITKGHVSWHQKDLKLWFSFLNGFYNTEDMLIIANFCYKNSFKMVYQQPIQDEYIH